MPSTDELTARTTIGILDTRFIRFLIVGGINTIFGYLVFAFLIFLKFHYALAVLLSTALGVLFNFKTTGRLVFGNGDNRLIGRFIGVYSVLYFVNVAALKFLNLLKMNMYLAGALMILPMAMLSFLMMKRFVFKGQQ